MRGVPSCGPASISRVAIPHREASVLVEVRIGVATVVERCAVRTDEVDGRTRLLEATPREVAPGVVTVAAVRTGVAYDHHARRVVRGPRGPASRLVARTAAARDRDHARRVTGRGYAGASGAEGRLPPMTARKR